MFLILSFVLAIGILPIHALPGLEKCVHDNLLKDLMQMQSTGGVDDLDQTCPYVLQIFDCLDNLVVNHTGLTISQLAELIPDETVQNGAKIFMNTRNVLTELCTEGMPFNKAYRENVECLSRLGNPLTDCEEKARDTYDSYKEFMDNSVEGGTPQLEPERTCMMESYKVACAAAYVMDQCGDASRALFQNLIKRTTYLKYGPCSNYDTGDLKTKFLSFIELSGQHRSVFADAFDFRRKKRSV
ncbi:uncharacterized protein LOC129225538 [Uloborus diversus]|uniref:uncharacterized protein LOC129225538 n=1 Tax=Uloborus diversus TaxID=327109 RepID=UPI0024090D08|nr:uncharacterized protein LOC129225538 [Uloborus diversus]